MTLEVLFEDNHLLAVNKPAGLPTMGARAGEHSLVEVAKEYLRKKYNKPGNVYLGVVSRLDAPVSGVLLLARNSKAAGRVARQFRERKVKKTYWAIVAGHPHLPRAELSDWLVKNDQDRRSYITNKNADGARDARLTYEVLKTFPAHALLKVELETGRKHQIRVQLSGRGHPIVGDDKYGSKEAFAAGIALHARELVIDHPKSYSPLSITAPLPRSWTKWIPAEVEARL